jgi:hypothetical protein
MLSCTSLRRSFSIFIFDSSAVRSMTVAFFRLPTFAHGWMWNLAMRLWEIFGPMPKKLSRERWRRQNFTACAVHGSRIP